MRRYLLTFAVAAALAAPTSAQAAFFPGEPIDGPGDAITALGEVELAPDGTGAVAYLKPDGGVDHVFVARFVDGRFQAPERVDAGLDAASSQPVVAADDEGRLAVAFVNGGTLHVVNRMPGEGFGTPQAIAGAASNPDVALGVGAKGYLVWVQPGSSAADLRAASVDRAGTWSVLPGILDIAPERDAGTGTGRPRVAVAADGFAIVAWGEAGEVWARKLFRTEVSQAPQQLSGSAVDGSPALTADLPEVDMEFDSSFAWVAFRQVVSEGGARDRVVARRMRGTEFDPPVAVDGLAQGVGGGATAPGIDLNGRGVGIATSAGEGGIVRAARLRFDAFLPTQTLTPAFGVPPAPVPVLSENNDGLVAYFTGQGVSARPSLGGDRDEGDGQPVLGEEAVLSAAGSGPVDAGKGLDASVDRAFGAVVVWVQGPPGAQTLTYGVHDRPPSSFPGYTGTQWRPLEDNVLTWDDTFELWGAVSYQPLLDGQPAGPPVAERRSTLPEPIPEGRHAWSVVATDIRGQTFQMEERRLLIDRTVPALDVRVVGRREAGERLRIRVRAKEPGSAGQASGLDFVRVTPGDGARIREGEVRNGKRFATRTMTVNEAYSAGEHELKVTAYDRAGNMAVERIDLRIRR
ncbi:MAG: hypothetical protein MSC31_12925 [Solirubrobacteraceae bacterium MAG38_C4-C5]|nr:hypothetical protein [Candidatus Siliceabacter maunaloa]